MPGAYDYDTIAELYGAIRTLLSQLVETSGEDNIFCSDAAMQIGADLVSLPGLTVITNLASALTAIDTIVFPRRGFSS